MDKVQDWLVSLQEPRGIENPVAAKKVCRPFAMPATPPESLKSTRPVEENLESLDLGSPSRKRMREPDSDIDATPRNVLRRRPVLEPKKSPNKRNRSPMHSEPSSPIKGLADLHRLEKPVIVTPAVTAAGYEALQQAGVQGLYRSIRRVLRYSCFVPIEIRHEFSALIKHRGDEAEEEWFATSQEGERRTCIEELGKLLDLHHEALESVTLGRHEAAWNAAVHHPLLKIAFDDGDGDRHASGERVVQDLRLRVENVTSATIAGDCLPRLSLGAPPSWLRQEQDQDTTDTPSIGAWSVSQITVSSSNSTSSTSSLSCLSSASRTHDDLSVQARRLHLDSTVHSKAGSKKVNFAVVCVPKPGTELHAATQAVLEHLKRTPALSYSISPSTYGPLVDAFIALSIETKMTTAARDPLIQLGLVSAAIHRRMHTLPVVGATGSSPLTEKGVIAPLPMIVVTSHQWDLYFACDQGRSIVCTL